MIKQIVLFLAIVLWIASVLDTTLGNTLYLVWVMAFAFSLYGYSFFFASEALLTSISFYFIDTASKLYFISTILPWLFGFLTVIFVIMVGVHYLSYGESKYVHDYSNIDKPARDTPMLWFF